MRHGAPATPGLLLGRTDAPATADGIAACHAAAATIGARVIVASDLIRARDCAPRAPRIDPRWRELDFGDWDGRSPAAIPPDRLSLFYDDPDTHAPPNGESWSALTARIAAALDDCAPDTLVVTHGGAIRAALAVTCGFGTRQLWAFHLPYAALLSLRCWPAGGTGIRGQIIGLRT
ncbi:histidine phosphatase family protein [Sphingomonas adhaesiva]|uniref:histidine phosphatase family protein n=1 Tax=Sphingomonas adhaesiva TaxID=28212 RepID=UPI002FF98C00